jgi:hypothetical protein
MSNERNQLFPAIEKALRDSSEPMSCTQLFAIPEVKKHAQSINRVSDYLGNLWRKNLVVRLHAGNEDVSRSRWCYQWKDPKVQVTDSVEYLPRVIADRPSVLVTELGNVLTLEFPNLVVQIRQKNMQAGD